MHHGRTKGSLYSPKKMLDAISLIDADVLCVQEIDHRSMRTFFANQPKQIAKKLNYEYRIARVRFFGAGFQNIAIFSRYDIVSSHHHRLPFEPKQQPRMTLSVTVDCGGAQIEVTTTHLHSHGSSKKPNTTAIDQLEHCLTNVTDARVSLVGADFNLEKEVVEIAEKHGYDAPSGLRTSPSSNPRRQIDWLLARGCQLSDTHVSDHLIGDHRALISSVTLD